MFTPDLIFQKVLNLFAFYFFNLNKSKDSVIMTPSDKAAFWQQGN